MFKKILAIALFLLIIVLAIPYIKTEYLTIMHGYDFEELYTQTNMIDHADYCKVLSYSDTHAEVIYVTRGDSMNVLKFTRSGDNWYLSTWETVWSKTGSADNLMYPIYF